MKHMHKIKQTVLSVAIGLFSLNSMAQNEVSIVDVTDNIHVLMGNGGNIGVSTGSDGTFLIDDKFAPMTENIIEALKSLGGDGATYLVNTHFHGDHSGGNENFGKTGTIILSHDNVRKRLAEGSTISAFNMVTPPQDGSALPVITFSDEMTIHLNGDAIDVVHVPNAHTDGDSIVHFSDSNVIHAGDIFFNGFFPFIDVEHGGSIGGTIDAIDVILARADENTIIIPGHGAVSNVDELKAYRQMLDTAQQRLSKLKADGKDASAAAAMKPLADLDEKWGKVIFNADSWIKVIYEGV